MVIRRINVKTKQKSYSIYIGNNILNKFNNFLKKERIIFGKCLIVADSNVQKKYIKKLRDTINCKDKYLLKIKTSEKAKSFNNVNLITDKLLKKKFSRNDCLIAVGGGILGDLCSFTASIFKRGMKFVNVPTTLLAQVDASVGGKTGINHKLYGKNLIGTFYQPCLVLSDTNLLKTLKKKEIICGYAEILKHVIISSKVTFNYLNRYSKKILELKKNYIDKAVVDSCNIKKIIVEKDEDEKNLRKVLNFGHTFGHAYEAAKGYTGKLTHGESVILGMKSAIKFSLKNKILNKKSYDLINGHINDINFGLKLNKLFKKKEIPRIVNYMENDKKNNSKKINLILLKDIGKPLLNNFYSKKKINNFLREELINL